MSKTLKLGKVSEDDFVNIAAAIGTTVYSLAKSGKHDDELKEMLVAVSNWQDSLSGEAYHILGKAVIYSYKTGKVEQIFKQATSEEKSENKKADIDNSDDDQDDGEDARVAKASINMGFSVPADATEDDIREAADKVRNQVIKDLTKVIEKAKRNEN